MFTRLYYNNMERIFNWEQWRIIAISTVSPLFGYLTPTKGFIYALVVMFAFNIWAGMRADGVAIVRCKNFSFRKFKNALCEFLLYLFIVETIFVIMKNCGDENAAVIVVKSLTYVFMYVYLQNAFRNLIIAYPRNLALRIIYHVIRLEFTRALPSHLQPIIDILEKEFGDDPDKNNKKKGETKMSKVVILDGGHGVDCAGKRSPIWGDGSQLFEWEFNRDIVRRIAAMLKAEGIKFEILVPEDNDVSLPERCRRANVIHADCGNNAVLFSVHGNAGGGTGWECYTSVGQTKADAIATVLCEEAEKEFAPDGWKMRFDYIDGDPDKESQFYILKHTVCPAVLSENFFMDTEKDCRFMMSDAGRERIAKVHYNTIKRIL